MSNATQPLPPNLDDLDDDSFLRGLAEIGSTKYATNSDKQASSYIAPPPELASALAFFNSLAIEELSFTQ